MPAPITTIRATRSRVATLPSVHVARLSLTALKGAAHTHPTHLDLTEHGARDDRRFCLVDPHLARVLRTIENPALVGCHAAYDGERLTVRLPDGAVVTGEVASSAQRLNVDYWGRSVDVSVVPGPWARAFTRLLDREVVLAQVLQPGAVIFGGAVTVLTTSSLNELAARLGRRLDPRALLADSERFRSTLVVDTADAPAFVEDQWVGSTVSVGGAQIDVTGAVPRCAVVRTAPREGTRDPLDPLKALAPDRTVVNERGREVVFGVEAAVSRAGSVRVGDAAEIRAGAGPSTSMFRSGVLESSGQ